MQINNDNAGAVHVVGRSRHRLQRITAVQLPWVHLPVRLSRGMRITLSWGKIMHNMQYTKGETPEPLVKWLARSYMTSSSMLLFLCVVILTHSNGSPPVSCYLVRLCREELDAQKI
jgi:hypothetical protein